MSSGHGARRTAPWLLGLIFVACGDGSAGVDREDEIVLAASQFQVLGSAEALGVVRDLAVLEDGSTWLLNSLEPLLVGFDPTGAPLEAHGRQGGGPDEFRAIAGLVVGGFEGRPWAFDNGAHALVAIPRDAQSEALPIPAESIPPGSVLPGMSLFGSSIRTAVLGEEVILPRRVGTDELQAITAWRTAFAAELVAWNPRSGSVRTVLSLPETLGDMTEAFDQLSSDFPPFPLWTRLWAVCGQDVWVYDFVRDEMRGVTGTGEPLTPVAIPPPFASLSTQEFARVLFDLGAIEMAGEVAPGFAEMTAQDSGRILSGLASRADGSGAARAAVLPKYVDFRCTPGGTFWLRPLDPERGTLNGGPVWIRVRPDGAVRAVRFPDRFDAFRFTEDGIWGVMRDAFDIPSVAWIAAPR